MAEKPIFINSSAQLKQLDLNFERLYYGVEFCERLFPTTRELRKVLKFVKNNDLEFSFVTPIVTNEGVNHLKKLLNVLKPGSEIIFNDWGVFYLIKKKFEPVMGRLLSKQNRTIQKFEKPYKSRMVSSFLSEQGIRRVEIDNSLVGHNYDLKNIKMSLYYPYEYVAVTRYCLFSDNLRNNPNTMILDCDKKCRKKLYKLTNPFISLDLYLQGNVKYMLSKEPIGFNKNVDRLVKQVI